MIPTTTLTPCSQSNYCIGPKQQKEDSVATTVADRVSEVLDHLGIDRAHFAASMLADLAEFAQRHPRRIASLTLVCPPRVDSSLRDLGDRLQIVTGDQSRPALMVREAVNSLPEAKVIW